MKRLGLASLWVLGLCMLGQVSWATQAYVTDSYKITLRTGPSVENKIISLLTSGQPVEILDIEGDWSQVRLSEGDKNAKEGWVLSRYLISRLPWEMQVMSLKDENAVLRERLADLESKWNIAVREGQELKGKLEQYMEALKDLQGRHQTLKSGAASYSF